jgi:LPS-assembly lipoprotein
MRPLPLAFAVLTALMLAACGFHPLYGGISGGGVPRAFASIYVEPVYDSSVAHTGYELRNSVIDILDANQGPAAYNLQMTLRIATQGVALQNDATITRYNDTLTVDYVLTDASSGKPVKTGTETGLSAYNVAPSPYATLAAQQDANKRVAQDIAGRIRIALGVFFNQRADAAR